jgi:hypothetical protein
MSTPFVERADPFPYEPMTTLDFSNLSFSFDATKPTTPGCQFSF